jgi:hypothetical protein
MNDFSPISIPGGWIKLHRQALYNGWLKNHVLWTFWSYCLLKAAYQPITLTVGYKRVPLAAGQFVFGRKQAAVELGMTERQVRTCLARLKSTGNLTINATSKFSVITVENWHTYQGSHVENDQQDDRHIDHQTTIKRPSSDHKQEYIEGKIPPPSSESLRLSGLMADLILLNNRNNIQLTNAKREATIHRWAREIDKLINIDKQEHEKIEAVIRWCQADTFWRQNILSGAKLREKWDQLVVKMNLSEDKREEGQRCHQAHLQPNWL